MEKRVRRRQRNFSHVLHGHRELTLRHQEASVLHESGLEHGVEYWVGIKAWILDFLVQHGLHLKQHRLLIHGMLLSANAAQQSLLGSTLASELLKLLKALEFIVDVETLLVLLRLILLLLLLRVVLVLLLWKVELLLIHATAIAAQEGLHEGRLIVWLLLLSHHVASSGHHSGVEHHRGV